MDVAGVHKGVGLAVFVKTEMHGSVDRVRKTVLEHPCEFRIFKQFLDTLYFGFDGFGFEETFLFGRAVGVVVALCMRNYSSIVCRTNVDSTGIESGAERTNAGSYENDRFIIHVL